MNNNLQTKMKKGFTLFELLVSMSIIAILIALASTSFSAAQKKARDSRRTEDVELVRKAAEQYYMLGNGSSYPPSANWSVGTTWQVNGTTTLAAYPSDPKGVGYSAPTIGAGNSTYCLCAYLESSVGNSFLKDCNYANAGTPKKWYCVNNQQ